MEKKETHSVHLQQELKAKTGIKLTIFINEVFLKLGSVRPSVSPRQLGPFR